MPSPFQVQWSHTVSWTVRLCGIPPSPPLQKDTLTSGYTKAQHSICIVLLRSGRTIINLFLYELLHYYLLLWKIILWHFFFNTVGWMDYLTISFIPVLSTFYFSTEDSKPLSTFKLTSANENSPLTSFATIVLFMNTLFIQYYLSLHTPTFWMHALHIWNVSVELLWL